MSADNLMPTAWFCPKCGPDSDCGDPQIVVEVSESVHETPNVPGCTCDRDDDSNEDGPIRLCPKHEAMLRPLRWDTLASIYVDFEAALRADELCIDALEAALTPERIARAIWRSETSIHGLPWERLSPGNQAELLTRALALRAALLGEDGR